MSNNKTRRVVVTGGAGLIGSFLVEQLLAQGNRVTVIDDFSKGSLSNLEGVSSEIEIREGDLECRSFAIESLEGFDVVYHLASRAYGVGYSEKHHLEMLLHNERVSTNLFEALAHSRPERILVTSSSCVYDDHGPDTVSELPTFQGEPEYVNRGYGWAKRFLEQKAKLFSEEAGVSTVIVRPFNIYGERYKWVGSSSQAIPMLVKRILDGESPVIVWGSGNQRRSYIHAEDCSRMMIELMQIGHIGTPVNLGTCETVSIRQLVEMIMEVAMVKDEIDFDLSKPEGRSIKSSDTALFTSLVPHFEFRVSLRNGLLRMLDWYERQFADT